MSVFLLRIEDRRVLSFCLFLLLSKWLAFCLCIFVPEAQLETNHFWWQHLILILRICLTANRHTVTKTQACIYMHGKNSTGQPQITGIWADWLQVFPFSKCYFFITTMPFNYLSDWSAAMLILENHFLPVSLSLHYIYNLSLSTLTWQMHQLWKHTYMHVSSS